MKDILRPIRPADPVSPAANRERNTANRIKLALLDEYTSGQEGRGYDPYNTRTPNRVVDVWRDKPKRR
jgi:hypothetical protein